jgi:hypothetical protein
MIKVILDLLTTLDHYGHSEEIEIAKGKFELPTTFKKGFIQIKRNWKWQRRK